MDQIDRNILYHLQHQARISMTELGKCVGLSQPAVTERVKRKAYGGEGDNRAISYDRFS